MPSSAYSVALLARGAGAYAYSYQHPGTLTRGQLCLVSFRGCLEIGLVLHADLDPPAGRELLPLLPLGLSGQPGFGALLADIAELAVAAPDEIAGHLLFDTPAKALRLQLELRDPAALEQEAGGKLLAKLAPLAGTLSPSRRKLLLKAQKYLDLVRLCEQGSLALSLQLSGNPEGTRRYPQWQHEYKLDAVQSAALGLAAQARVLRGAYLAGFAEAPDWKALKKAKAADTELAKVPESAAAAKALRWENASLDKNWDIVQRWPQLAGLTMRRCAARWPDLSAGTLRAELQAALAAGEQVLLITPLSWMLDRLWPQLAAIHAGLLRFRSDHSALAVASVLHALTVPGGHIVAGGPGAWKLAAYAHFDRVILLDPTHPQYEARGEPWLEARTALLLAAAHAAGSAAAPPRIDFIELGLSVFDGTNGLGTVHFDLERSEDEMLAAIGDLPSPRLVFLNRLGTRRGLSCAECRAAIKCPTCGGARIYFSSGRKHYWCPDCESEQAQLRCKRCGLMTFSASTIGLEAFKLAPGDVLLTAESSPAGDRAALRVPPGANLLGTARLLEPPAGFAPASIVYVHSEGQLGPLDDWPRALDMLARLDALYAAPADGAARQLYAARLLEQLGDQLDGTQLSKQYRMELKLRKLGGLPPYACLYQLHLRGTDQTALKAAREALGSSLKLDSATQLLRLGAVYGGGLAKEAGGARLYRCGGFFINPRLGQAELQALRWQVHGLGAGLQIQALRGPWI